MTDHMVILNSTQIGNKLQRIASEIFERHADSGQLILAGINNKGYLMASDLSQRLKAIGMKDIRLCRLKLNPAKPLETRAELDIPVDQLSGKVVIVVDDVANSGRTLFFAMQPMMEVLLKSLEICVLIERMHKSYPVSVDYVGLRLATTVKQNIEVAFSEDVPVEAGLI
ncbi:MAG: phosphoribosyltransferase family protein [Saprospiraceae bacterium]